MALDAKDIAAIRANVPPAHQPPQGAAGLLSEHFLSVDLLRKSTALQGSENPARAQENELYRRGLAALTDIADGRNPGFLLPGPLANIWAARISKSDERKREDERRYVIRQIISQIEARNRQIAENLKRLAELERQETALDKHLAGLRRGEKPELDKDGKLRDRAVEKAIRDYEDRYGVKVDRADADQIAAVLHANRAEQAQLRRDNADLTADNARDQRLARDMGADPDSIPATIRAAERTEDGKRIVNAATAALEQDDLKREVIVAKGYDAADQAFAMDNRSSDDSGFNETAQVELPATDAAKPRNPSSLPKPG